MRPTTITMGAAGTSAWTPIDYRQNTFGIGIGCTITSGASLTYKIQHTFDSPYDLVPFTGTRSTTTATATIPDHRLSVGDTLLIVGADAPFDGRYLVASVVNANNVTYTVANSGATVTAPGSTINLTRAFDNAVITGQTGNKDSNYAFPPRAIRLNVTSYASGKVTATIIQGSP